MTDTDNAVVGTAPAYSAELDAINALPGVRRIENLTKDEMQAFCFEKTHSVYPHDEVYGQYCTLEEYIDVPPEEVFAYLADLYTLGEWTYSMRDFEEMDDQGRVLSTDKIGGKTKIWTKCIANADAMTVDFHCAWDQPDQLWMIYLMRVIDAQVVLGKPGSVVLWTNCKHPNYEKNPFPQAAPEDRKIWVGDMWPFFFAGHWVEMQNLKNILEYRHSNGLPLNPRRSGS